MKRVLSLVLALVMVFGTIMPAFADDAATTAADSQAGQDLKSYGVIAGTDLGLEEASVLTREQMTVILSQLYGKKTEAEAYAFAPSFTDVEEGKWSTPYIAFAEQQGWMSGDAAGGTFRPTDVMKAQEVNAMFVKALGYTVEWADVNTKAEELEVAITAADSTSVLRGEAFAALRATLDVPKMDETDTLGTALALTNYVSPTPAAPETVEITGAVAINSVLVEVSLDDDIDAPTAVTADQFTVVDEDDAAIEIASVEFAAWDADNYTVLVKLADDVEAGSLYTVASGDTDKNFGGLDEDEDEVADVTAESTDYNEVTLTFTEGVDLDTLVLELEENNSGDEVAVLNMAYDGKDTVVLTTDAQEKVLYKVTVTAVEDLAGNDLDSDLTYTFVGTEMPDDEQTVEGAIANYTDEIIVEFGTKVNEDDLDAANFTIVENNDTDEEIVVLEARLATDDDKNCTTAQEGFKVVLTTETTAKKLYKLTVADVGTKYGEKLDTDKEDTTFVGVALPDDDFGYSDLKATSNTTVTLVFPNKMDKAIAEDIANYTIVENNDADEELVITAAELDDDNVTVELTVEEMSKTLYKMTVANVEDVYGNEIDSDKDEETFVGQKVADAIDDIKELTINADGTELTVTFDQNVGDNATDIANYVVDGSIGYPTKVSTVSGAGNEAKVKLTIKETTKSKVYKLTVTGLENADGVVMDSDDEVTENFVGTGSAADEVKVVAAESVNKSLLKIYFDTDVDDFDTTLFTKATGQLDKAGKIEVTVNSVKTDLASVAHFAVIDETDDKALLVYVDPTAYTFTEKGNDEIYDLLVTSTDVDTDNDDSSFAYSDDTATEIDVVAVESVNSNTVKIYFNQPVRRLVTGFAKFDIDEAADAAISGTPQSANDAMTEWFVVLNDEMEGNDKYTMKIQANVNDFISVTTTDVDYVIFEADTETVSFAGDDSTVAYIDSVSVMMTDEKTIVVTYPEAMNEADVETVGNYDFLATSGGTAAAMTAAGTFVAADDIGDIHYDSDDHTATIMLKDTFKSTQDSVYVEFQAGIKNVLETKTVKAIAVDDEAAAEVALDDLDAVATDQNITITLTQTVTLAVAYTAGDGADADSDPDGLQAFLADYSVKINEEAVVLADIVSAELGAGALADDQILLVLKAGTFTTDAAVKVTAKDTTNVTGDYNAEALEEDSSLVVAASGADITVPTFGTVSIASNNATTTLAKIGDVVTVTFVASEKLQTPVVTIDGNAATVAASADKINWSASYTMVTGDTQASLAFTINGSDLAGNAATEDTTVDDATTVTFDETAPTVDSADLTAGTTIVVVFSEAVDVVAGDFTDGKFLDNSDTDSAQTFTVDSISGTGTATITLTITPSVAFEAADVTVSVDIDADDLAGNNVTSDDEAVTNGL